MSIASVVSRGFGAFGSMHLLPPLGYGSSAVAGALICEVGCVLAEVNLLGAKKAQVNLLGARAIDVNLLGGTAARVNLPGASEAECWLPGGRKAN